MVDEVLSVLLPKGAVEVSIELTGTVVGPVERGTVAELVVTVVPEVVVEVDSAEVVPMVLDEELGEVSVEEVAEVEGTESGVEVSWDDGGDRVEDVKVEIPVVAGVVLGEVDAGTELELGSTVGCGVEIGLELIAVEVDSELDVVGEASVGADEATVEGVGAAVEVGASEDE